MDAQKIRKFTLAGIFIALIIVMTVVPFTGYISYGGGIEITTLHIVVILGAVCLGWTYGAIFGAVWGLTCMVRAVAIGATEFVNPLISLVPRVVVGMVAGALFAGLVKLFQKRTNLKRYISHSVSAVIATVAATLTNTVLVLFAYDIFGHMTTSVPDFFDTFKSIIIAIGTVNGGIELVAAAVIVPSLYAVIQKVYFK